MRYIGSKQKVIGFISSFVEEKAHCLEGKVFADLFAGTATVGTYFKERGCSVISNDYMSFSYALQIAKIKLNDTPEFVGLRNDGLTTYQDVVNWLNTVEPVKGFFFRNYTIEGSAEEEYSRNYFSEENAKKIDGILKCIRRWREKNSVTFEEEMLLKASLIDAAVSVSNISGTYGAFLKAEDRRKYKTILLKPIPIGHSKKNHTCYNKDIFNILPEVKGDILYLDPPYNQRQYPPYYHILETITLDDEPSIYGKTGRRPYKDKLSAFCLKNEAATAIDKTISMANFEHIFVSYNTDGLVSKDDMMGILAKYGVVDCALVEQRRYKSNSYGTDRSSLKELLFYVRKEKINN